MDIFKNVQKWNLQDYLFFEKKKFLKFEKKYLRFITRKEFEKFRKMIFFEIFLGIGQKLGDFCCAFFRGGVV